MFRQLVVTLAFANASVTNAQSASYAVEPGHTFAYFKVVHPAPSTFRGYLDNVQGAITLNQIAKKGQIVHGEQKPE